MRTLPCQVCNQILRDIELCARTPTDTNRLLFQHAVRLIELYYIHLSVHSFIGSPVHIVACLRGEDSIRMKSWHAWAQGIEPYFKLLLFLWDNYVCIDLLHSPNHKYLTMVLTVFQEVYSVLVDPRLKGSELNKDADLLIRKCGFKSLLQEAFTLLMQLTLTWHSLEHRQLKTNQFRFRRNCYCIDVSEAPVEISKWYYLQCF